MLHLSLLCGLCHTLRTQLLNTRGRVGGIANSPLAGHIFFEPSTSFNVVKRYKNLLKQINQHFTHSHTHTRSTMSDTRLLKLCRNTKWQRAREKENGRVSEKTMGKKHFYQTYFFCILFFFLYRFGRHLMTVTVAWH